MKNRNSATTTGAAIIQSLERYAPLFSNRWNARSTRFPALVLLSFALLLPVPVAAATSIELPGGNDADWPLMSVLLDHERIAE